MSSTVVRRENGKLVFEIEEERFLADATAGAPDLRLIDREEFLRFATAHLFTLTHDIQSGAPATWWQRLAETLGKAAAATGHGIQHGRVIEPTCGCDPEEHDGG